MRKIQLLNTRIKFALIAFLFTFIQSISLAQRAREIDYIVLVSGDTLIGEVVHLNKKGFSPRYLKKIRYTDSNRKNYKINRKDISTFKIDDVIYDSFWLSRSSRKFTLDNPIYTINYKTGKHYFLRLMKSRDLSHYQLEWWEQGESTPMSMDLLKKENDQFLIRATQGIFGLKRNTLTQYFSECVELSSGIKQRKFNTLDEIIDIYNAGCIY